MGEIRRFYIDFWHRPLEEYQKFTAYTSPGVGVGVAFFVSVFRSRDLFARERSTHMADSTAVGINEMFRRLRSAKLSHVADTFIGK